MASLVKILFSTAFCWTAVCVGRTLPRADVFPIEDVIFQLYTQKNASNGVRLTIGDSDALESVGFDKNVPTKILVHGWMDNMDSLVIQILKKEFLALEPMNVIGVVYTECSYNVLYEQSVACAKQVGEYIGKLITWLITTTGLEPSDVHGIGHSLGGEAITFASKSVKIGRISALDPAAPLFSHENTDNRIDVGDADFVDVYHTSVKILGLKYPVGHVDFYINGGADQPGCGGLVGHCAHTAVTYYYGNTISEANRNNYMAYQCETLDDGRNSTCIGEPQLAVGYGVSPQSRGIYYVNITSVPYTF